MKIEHFAFNVSDPVKMAAWYEKHLGMQTVFNLNESPFTYFIADESGDVMLEIYNKPSDEVPDYKNQNPLLLHLAFVSDDPDADTAKLLDAGATMVVDEKMDDGSHLVMLRDPWGLAIQLCKRGNPMLKMQKK
ncbi:MAG: glyoxalase/bleomycin resistance/dioxygenase family protein [Planctomycetota bacterium]|nr:MAG: glyoxalase/bleomycin resistance/dioxygenase family protein [Planctomycetota bacterium]